MKNEVSKILRFNHCANYPMKKGTELGGHTLAEDLDIQGMIYNDVDGEEFFVLPNSLDINEPVSTIVFDRERDFNYDEERDSLEPIDRIVGIIPKDQAEAGLESLERYRQMLGVQNPPN